MSGSVRGVAEQSPRLLDGTLPLPDGSKLAWKSVPSIVFGERADAKRRRRDGDGALDLALAEVLRQIALWTTPQISTISLSHTMDLGLGLSSNEPLA